MGKAALSGTNIPASGNCRYWRDDLSVGPVPASRTLSSLSRVREAYWTSPTPLQLFAEAEFSHWLERASDEQPARVEGSSSSRAFLLRDQHFENLAIDRSVVWCGRNTAEVLMLAAILNFSNGVKLGQGFPAVVRLGDHGAHACGTDESRRAFDDRIVGDAVDAGYLSKLWAPYTASEPGLLNGLSAPPAGAPLAHWCHHIVPDILSEYPSVKSGLSRTEEMLLREASSRRPVVWIVAETLGKARPAVGDRLLYETLWNFTMGEAPLLEAVDGALPVASASDFRKRVLQPTALGLEVLRGRKDYVSHGHVDRWIGGVHLQGAGTPWRLDRRTMKIVRI